MFLSKVTYISLYTLWEELRDQTTNLEINDQPAVPTNLQHVGIYLVGYLQMNMCKLEMFSTQRNLLSSLTKSIAFSSGAALTGG